MVACLVTTTRPVPKAMDSYHPVRYTTRVYHPVVLCGIPVAIASPGYSWELCTDISRHSLRHTSNLGHRVSPEAPGAGAGSRYSEPGSRNLES